MEPMSKRRRGYP